MLEKIYRNYKPDNYKNAKFFKNNSKDQTIYPEIHCLDCEEELIQYINDEKIFLCPICKLEFVYDYEKHILKIA